MDYTIKMDHSDEKIGELHLDSDDESNINTLYGTLTKKTKTAYGLTRYDTNDTKNCLIDICAKEMKQIERVSQLVFSVPKKMRFVKNFYITLKAANGMLKLLEPSTIHHQNLQCNCLVWLETYTPFIPAIESFIDSNLYEPDIVLKNYSKNHPDHTNYCYTKKLLARFKNWNDYHKKLYQATVVKRKLRKRKPVKRFWDI